MNDDLKERRIKFLKEAKCSEEGCYNYRINGLIYCIRHLYGSPIRMTDEEIQWLKEDKQRSKNKGEK